MVEVIVAVGAILTQPSNMTATHPAGKTPEAGSVLTKRLVIPRR